MSINNATARKTGEIDILLGKRVMKLRRSNDLSQKFVADHIGVSFQQLQKYEKGINRISASRLWRLSQLFNTTPNHFFIDVLATSAAANDISTPPSPVSL